MQKGKLSPVLKWAGGKTQLLDHIAGTMPAAYRRYYEPFVGGGAALFGLTPARASVNDRNEPLMNLYAQIRDSVEGVIERVRELDAAPCGKTSYYALRERYNEKVAARAFDAECAALMIWINKHCYNGLYRVNRKGRFNVPYNNRTGGKSVQESNLRAISDYLRTSDVTLTCLDFEEACAGVSAGDFVYFDSPYVPESPTASFTDYTTGGFSPADHERLAALFRRLDRIGAKVMLSNSDVPLVRSLYAGYRAQVLDARRQINRDARKRTGREVLITNYGP
ncbi:MAG: DNA adenine methylase [Oscillibacter sp.]|nr:DNA adenine methylase [Oscillibacter sp.]